MDVSKILDVPDFYYLLNDVIDRIEKDEKFKTIFEGIETEPAPLFAYYAFPQTWGSTALGFEGVGGSALTTKYTTVIEDTVTGVMFVYFDEEYAYTVYEPNAQFFNDLYNQRLESVRRSIKYDDNNKRF